MLEKGPTSYLHIKLFHKSNADSNFIFALKFQHLLKEGPKHYLIHIAVKTLLFLQIN